MIHRFRLPMLLSGLALALLIVATITLRDAPTDLTGAVGLFLIMLFGAGIGFSIDLHLPKTRRH